jgi:1-aminocyclopropane-1-carboxylate deaminase/D-cysteine desulfhydrase-like pyridoxal-dependent ACC family enzyme
MASPRSSAEAVARELSEDYGNLVPYTAPDWAREKNLKIVPQKRYVLCMRPTPIHRWNVPGVPPGFRLSIKRDDMTGSTLTGNKVRALEFHLAEARARQCDVVVTVGGLQSNHCRSTAVACRAVGMETHLLLAAESRHSLGSRGNMLLNRMSGACIVPLTPDLRQSKTLDELVQEYDVKLRSQGRNPYTVPVGGHSPVGLWGYLEAYQELIEQGLWTRFSDIVVCSGSGGTSSALAIANYLTGSRIKVHAVAVPVPGCVPIRDLQNDMEALGVEGVAASDILDVIEGYNDDGYGVIDGDLLEMMVDIFSTTAMSLDTTYQAKTVRGLLGEMKSTPGRFQGRDVLYIHTGGVFSTLDGTLDEVVQSRPVSSQILPFSKY